MRQGIKIYIYKVETSLRCILNSSDFTFFMLTLNEILSIEIKISLVPKFSHAKYIC